MATKILGQAAPLATTDTDVYTVPEGFEAIIRIQVCERAGAAATVTLYLRPDGATATTAHRIVEDHPLIANEVNSYGPFAVSGGDVVTANNSTADTTVLVTGIEKAIL